MYLFPIVSGASAKIMKFSSASTLALVALAANAPVRSVGENHTLSLDKVRCCSYDFFGAILGTHRSDSRNPLSIAKLTSSFPKGYCSLGLLFKVGSTGFDCGVGGHHRGGKSHLVVLVASLEPSVEFILGALIYVSSCQPRM